MTQTLQTTTTILLLLLCHGITSAQSLDGAYGDRHWSAQFGDPSIGFVRALAASEGALFMTGTFDLPNGASGPGVVRRDAETGTFQFIGQQQIVPGRENLGWIGSALATPDLMFFGGLFNLGEGRQHLAVWDRSAQTWTHTYDDLDHRVADFDRGPNGSIYVLTRFIFDHQAPWYGRVSRWTGNSWTALGDSLEVYPTAIAAGENGVYISVKPDAGSCCYEIRRWTGSAWTTVGQAESEGHVVGVVNTLTVDGTGALYAGGVFSKVGGTPTRDIARWDGSTWHALGKGLGRESGTQVHDIAVHDGTVYAAGRIDTAGTTPAENIAVWDGNSWSIPDDGMNGDIHDLALDGQQIYASGSFDRAGSRAAHDIAVSPLTSYEWMPLYDSVGMGIPGTVDVVAADGNGGFIAGGHFETAGSTRTENIARWTDQTWEALGTGLQGDIEAIATDESTIYAGGELERPDDTLSHGLAVWSGEGSTWQHVGADDAARRLVSAEAFLVREGDLYAAGKLQTGGDENAVGLFRRTSGQWTIVGEIHHEEGGRTSPHLAVDSNGNLYLAGHFTSVDNVEAKNIARWDGSSWHPLGEGLPQRVGALDATNARVFAAAGERLPSEAVRTDSLRIWNRELHQWSAIESGLEPDERCHLAISTIKAGTDYVYVGAGLGICTTAETSEFTGGDHLGRWDGEEWMIPGTGIAGTVHDLSLSGDNLFVGGRFETAGKHASLNIARWNPAKVLESSASDVPVDFVLHPNYPNPFNPTTTILYELRRWSDVEIHVYDAMGRRVATLIDTPQSVGQHRATFDGTDLPSGVYFYRLQTDRSMRTRSMLLVK